MTGLLGLPMWFDMTAEYVLGFAFGLFIFQALFMKDMMGGSYRNAPSSFIPEWVSMNAMMAGMFPAMVIMMGAICGPWTPRAPLLGHDVPGHRRRLPHGLPGQLVAGEQRGSNTADDSRPCTVMAIPRRDTMGGTRPKRHPSPARAHAHSAHARRRGLRCIPTRKWITRR